MRFRLQKMIMGRIMNSRGYKFYILKMKFSESSAYCLILFPLIYFHIYICTYINTIRSLITVSKLDCGCIT